MVLRPEDIEQREFGSALRGFDKSEVRAFLRRVAGEIRFLESEVEAARADEPVEPTESETGTSEPVATEGSSESAERPTPPTPDSVWPTGVGDALGRHEESPTPDVGEVTEPPHEPSPAWSAGPSAETDTDRFAALGDRIAGLLRNAQETAEQLRNQAEAEAETTRADADAYATETRAAADEVLVAARAEAAELVEAARADADEARANAGLELDEARAQAGELKQQAIENGLASLSGREAEIAEREAEVAAERERAMAELGDARGQVSQLLQEARAQSEFIRQESEEIIRTKVRANLEQAQRRIDVLRTTEIASKDRIAAARRELEGALARLEAEPAPVLPEGTEDLVLEEARERATSLAAPAAPDHDVIDVGSTPVEDSTAVADADVVDADVVPTDETGFDPAEYEDAAADFGFDAVDEPSTADAVAESPPTDLEDLGADESPIEPPDDAEAQPDATSFDDAGFDDAGFDDAGFDEVLDGDDPSTPPMPPLESITFQHQEPMPTEPEVGEFDFSPADRAEGEPNPGAFDFVPAPAEAVVTTSDDDGEAAPDETPPRGDAPDNEDALAKLVREAMQRAVDAARGNDS